VTTFRLAEPLWLLLLLPAAAVLVAAQRGTRRYSIVFSSLEGLRNLPRSLAQRLKRGLPAVRFLGLSLLVVSLARPQEGRAEFRVRTEGISMVMAIDRSGSMEALDFQIEGKRQNRLEVVKNVFRDFVAGKGDLPGRPDDRIGLVVFGGFAEGVCPLTLDHGALLSILETVKIPKPIHDRQGNLLNRDFYEEELATAIGDGLALAVERLQDIDARSKVVVLLSDGVSNAGIVSPLDAAQAAHALGIKVYAIGVGSNQPVPFPTKDLFGRDQLVVRQVEFDETTLKTIAETTGGKYFNATDTDSLRGVCEEIDRLEKTETDSLLYTEYRELYDLSLVPGLLLLLLDFVLRCTRFSTLP